MPMVWVLESNVHKPRKGEPRFYWNGRMDNGEPNLTDIVSEAYRFIDEKQARSFAGLMPEESNMSAVEVEVTG